ncbi:hypothetical protein AB4171_04730, partial [Vibrio sp. 10N.286.51.A4]|uniref:hypothetical protein n=1 Tax=Vibrio sp. 10N.286.51.A4 TaxID=3229705 RepID=UPI00354BD1F2
LARSNALSNTSCSMIDKWHTQKRIPDGILFFEFNLHSLRLWLHPNIAEFCGPSDFNLCAV